MVQVLLDIIWLIIFEEHRLGIVSLDRLDYSGNLNRIQDTLNDYKDNDKEVRIVYHDLRAEINNILTTSWV